MNVKKNIILSFLYLILTFHLKIVTVNYLQEKKNKKKKQEKMKESINPLSISVSLIRERKENLENPAIPCIGSTVKNPFDIKKGDILYKQKGHKGFLSSLVGMKTAGMNSGDLRRKLIPVGVATEDVKIGTKKTVFCKNIGEFILKGSTFGFKIGGDVVVDLPLKMTELESETYINEFKNRRYTLQFQGAKRDGSADLKLFKKVLDGTVLKTANGQNIILKDSGGYPGLVNKIVNGICFITALGGQSDNSPKGRKVLVDITGFNATNCFATWGVLDVVGGDRRTTYATRCYRSVVDDLKGMTEDEIKLIKRPQDIGTFGRVISIKRNEILIKIY